MACADPFLQLNDQSFALQLQLKEIEVQRELQSGKWTEDSPPDFALAFDDFEAEEGDCSGPFTCLPVQWFIGWSAQDASLLVDAKIAVKVSVGVEG
jgi:hypothetical protein